MASENGGPGVVEGLRAMAMRPLEKAVAERRVSEARRAQADTLLTKFEEVAKRVEPESNDWIPVMGGGLRELGQSDRETLRQRAQKAALRKPLMVGYLRTLLRYVMGEGPEITAATDDDPLNEQMDEWWGTFSDVNDWQNLEDEIPKRTWRDGEVFLRKFVNEVEGPPESWEPTGEIQRRIARMDGATLDELKPPTIPAGMVEYRIVPPGQIKDPKDKVDHGIVTSATDAQTVLGYVWTPDGESAELIPASDMRHIKIRTDSDVKRGRSLLEPLLRRNKQYEDWLQYRILLNLARSALVLEKTVDGSPSEVQNIRDARQTEDTVPGNDRKVRAFEPMTTVTKSKGIEYEFKNPNLDARDASEDGRNIQLNMAAATGMPEYLFTGDASNANYSSTLVSESPAIREFESWQDFFTPHYKGIWREVMTEAAKAGQIDPSPEDVAEMEPHVAWPSMEVREEIDHAKAQQVRMNAGILSKQTWAEEAGLDWETEQARMEEERDRAFERTPPPEPPQPDDEEGEGEDE